MPIPFILAGIVAAGAGVVGAASNAVKNDAKNELTELNEKIEKEIDLIENRYNKSVDKYKKSVSKLIDDKKRIYNGTLKEFKEIYKNIGNIEVEETAIEDKSLLSQIDLDMEFTSDSLNYNQNFDEISLTTLLATGPSVGFIAHNYLEYRKIQDKIEDAEAAYEVVKTKKKAVQTKVRAINYNTKQMQLVSKLLSSINIRLRMALKVLRTNTEQYGYDYRQYPLEVKKQLKMTRDYAVLVSMIIKSSGIKEDGSLNEQINEAVTHANKVLEVLAGNEGK